MAATTDPKQLSPKVRAGALMGLLISLLGAVVAAVVTFGLGVTPDTLGGLGLGIWAVPAATLITTAAQALAAWWKTDPLREQQALTDAQAATLFQSAVDVKFKNQG